MKNKFAFTLAESMIVLAVIGVLSAILLPVIQKARVNKNLMLFKESHNTLMKAVQELVTSDKYYLDGDLGIRANGNLVDSTHEGDNQYLCETVASVVQYKEKNCIDRNSGGWYGVQISNSTGAMDNAKTYFDDVCSRYRTNGFTREVVFKNGTIFFQSSIHMPFGMSLGDLLLKGNGTNDECATLGTCEHRAFGFGDFGNFRYKIVCLDIDDQWGGQEPFGYGLSPFGKIIPGVRATEWLEKTAQEN